MTDNQWTHATYFRKIELAQPIVACEGHKQAGVQGASNENVFAQHAENSFKTRNRTKCSMIEYNWEVLAPVRTGRKERRNTFQLLIWALYPLYPISIADKTNHEAA